MESIHALPRTALGAVAERSRWAKCMSSTPANMRTGLLLVVLCCFGAGCAHFSTPAEHDASFSAYKDAKVGHESLREYLLARSGMLLRGVTLDTTCPGTNSFRFATKDAGFGTATAI